MNPGKLDRRIVLQVRTLSKDGAGGRVETWADSATLWAEIVTQKGSEKNAADSERPLDTRVFRIRYRSINPQSHRILYQSKFYNILGTTEEGGRRNTLVLETIAAAAVPA